MAKKNKPVSSANTEIRYTNLYESEGKVYTRKITGFFQKIRRYSTIPLLLAYILLPWLTLDGRPAVLFDLPARQFHVFWVTFWPQDFVLLAGLLIISAFSLFTVTALFGRVWCGFTCPQTAWTLMFISVERLFEGSRNQQIKLDSQPLNFNKALRKGGKHLVWVLIGLITGLSFVAYFVPIRELLTGLLPYRDEYGMISFTASPVAIFWVLFFTVMTYLNAGWLRVQVCKYMCPYARFQSVMYDENTLAVYYDASRGEPRGNPKINKDTQEKGDCVDCTWCVQVCPVDIDIRDGMQYECINCGLCVDACNAVMEKVKSPKGLIRFTSENALANKGQKLLRPRLIIYLSVISVLVLTLVYSIANREPIGFEVERDRGMRLYRVKSGNIQNVYTIKVYNMDEKDHKYRLWLESDAPFQLASHRPIDVPKGGNTSIPIKVWIKKSELKYAKSNIDFYIEVIASEENNKSMITSQSSSFFGPSKQ